MLKDLKTSTKSQTEKYFIKYQMSLQVWKWQRHKG